MVRVLSWAFAAALSSFMALDALKAAEPISPEQIRDTMRRVESLLEGEGIAVAGYARSAVPTAAFVTAAHPYLQGHDGGFVDGRIYVSEGAIASCLDLILVHELVHDATIKHRLFAAVPNARVKDAIEALADRITELAAEDPYRPGCLPHRSFAYSGQELAALAMASAAP